jgi:hypothetical protein
MLFLIGGALWMLLQELRQRERGQTDRLLVIVAVRYPVTELASYDLNMSRWRTADITIRGKKDVISQPLLKTHLNS